MVSHVAVVILTEFVNLLYATREHVTDASLTKFWFYSDHYREAKRSIKGFLEQVWAWQQYLGCNYKWVRPKEKGMNFVSVYIY